MPSRDEREHFQFHTGEKIMEYIFFLIGGAGLLAILSYFDAYNDCNVPLDYLLIFLAIAAMAFVYSFLLTPMSEPSIFDAVVFCVIAVLFRVIKMWNTADMMVFAGIALLLPQMAFLALVIAWALYVVHYTLSSLKTQDSPIIRTVEESHPFIPYLFIAYLLSAVAPMFFSVLRT
jgi:hypothetical protein